ncbi:hypothetical protein Ancab_030227, partial [Ancistrocladus abbreviatus]
AALMEKEIWNGEEARQLEGNMMVGEDGADDFFNRSEGVAELFKQMGGPSDRLGERVGRPISSEHSSEHSSELSLDQVPCTEFGPASPDPQNKVTEPAIGGVESGPMPEAGLNLTTYSRKKRNNLRQTHDGPLEVMEPKEAGEDSISDSNIQNMNRIFLLKERQVTAQEV